MDTTADDGAAAGGEASEVRVQFHTRQKRYTVTDTPLAVPVSVRRSHLSQIVNHLLQLDSPRPFDFLIDSEFLRAGLGAFLEARGRSTEELVRIEYVEALPPPEPSVEFAADEWIASIACHPTRPLVLMASYDGQVGVVNHSSELVAAQGGHTDIARAVAWVPSQGGGAASEPDALVSGSEDETVRLWRLTRDASPATLACAFVGQGHLASVNAVAVQPTGKLVCSGSSDRSLRIWRTDPDEDDMVAAPAAPTAASGKRRRVQDAQQVIKSIGTMTGHTASVNSVVWPERGLLYSAGEDHCIRSWDVQTGSNLNTLTGSKVILDLSHNATTKLLASAEFDGNVRVYSGDADGSVIKLVLSSHKAPASSVAWSPTNSHQLVSGSYDDQPHNVKLWDVRSPKIPVHNIGAHEDKVLAADWVQPGVIATAGADKKVKFFQVTSAGATEQTTTTTT